MLYGPVTPIQRAGIIRNPSRIVQRHVVPPQFRRRHQEVAFTPIPLPDDPKLVIGKGRDKKLAVTYLLDTFRDLAWLTKHCFTSGLYKEITGSEPPDPYAGRSEDVQRLARKKEMRDLGIQITTPAPIIKTKMERNGVSKISIPITLKESILEDILLAGSEIQSGSRFSVDVWSAEVEKAEKYFPNLFNVASAGATFRAAPFLTANPEEFDQLLDWTSVKEAKAPLAKKAMMDFITGIRLIWPPMPPLTIKKGTEEVHVSSREEALDLFKARTINEFDMVEVFRCFAKRMVTLYINFEFSKELTQYFCQTEKPTPGLVFQWAAQMARGCNKPSGKTEYSETINPLTNIKELNAQQMAKRKGPPKKLSTKDENLCLDKHGALVYVPEVDSIDEYYRIINEVPLDDQGEYSWADITENKQITRKVKISNMLLLTDWINNKFSYTDGNGNLVVEPMDGWVPVMPTAVDAIFSQQIEPNRLWLDRLLGLRRTSSGSEKMSLSYDFTPHIEKWKDKFNIDPALVEEWYGKKDLYEAIIHIFNMYAGFVNRERNKDIFLNPDETYKRLKDEMRTLTSENLQFKDLAPDSQFPELRVVGDWFSTQLTAIRKAPFVDLIGDKSCSTIMRGYGTLFVFGNYLHRHKDVQGAAEAMTKQYRRDTKADEKAVLTYVPKGIPLVKNLEFQPHQAKVDNILKDFPPFAILNVQAGGGKTIQVLTDVLRCVAAGVVKRPLIMCPQHLVKDYVKEAAKITGGRLNVICLNVYTMSPNVWGEQMEALIDAAPPNTIYVADYDYPRNNVDKVPYGTTTTDIMHNANFIEGLGFDGVWCDESHWLKNVDSARAEAMAKIIAGAKIRRLATGTFLANTLMDVVGQFNLLDPSIFGTVKRFRDEYVDPKAPLNVYIPKNNLSTAKIHDLISKNCAYITVKRREWAALLPESERKFWPAELTEEQRKLYELILQEAVDEMKADDKLMQAFEDSEDDDSLGDSIEEMLKPYLQRLERYLAAPARDELGDRTLQGADRISPKAKIVKELILDHFARKIPGKIIVFTEYIPTAHEVYDSMGELQPMCISYLAANKVELLDSFEKNPKYKVLIGVSDSLSTGLNLQYCSRLIRVETVWTPAEMEQGDSRINRPSITRDPKTGKSIPDPRTVIYFDSIMVNRTIDVTKVARLSAKMIENAKFESTLVPAYGDLPTLTPPTMSLDSIRASNDHEEELHEHYKGLSHLVEIERADFAAYRARTDVRTTRVPVPDGAIPRGSKLLKYIPYVAGVDIFNKEKLKLVPYHEYRELQGMSDKDIVDPETKAILHKGFDPVGLPMHTMYGDGDCTAKYKGTVSVRLFASGRKVTADKENCFIIDKKTTSTKAIREQLSELIEVPLSTGDIKPAVLLRHDVMLQKQAEKEEEIKPKRGRVTPGEPRAGRGGGGGGAPKDPRVPRPKTGLNFIQEKKLKGIKGVEGVPIELHAGFTNGMYSLTAPLDKSYNKALAKLKFKLVKPYVYAVIKTPQLLEKYMTKLVEEYRVVPFSQRMLGFILKAYSKSKARGLFLPTKVNPVLLMNFYRIDLLRPSKQGTVKPYPVTHGDVLHLVYDIKTQPSALEIFGSFRVPGVKHYKSPGEWVYMTQAKPKLSMRAQEIRGVGMEITNLEELNEEYKRLVSKGS